MDSNDTAPKDEGQKIEVKTAAPQDITVDDKDIIEDTSATSESANVVTAPEPMMDVTPPPQDEVVAAPAEPTSEQSETEAETSTSDASTEQVFTPAGAEAMTSVAELPKKSGKGLVVAIAVVLALVLAAIAVLVYMKANTTTKSTAETSTADQTTQQAKVTATDVDAATKEVDDTLSTLNDANDFASDVLSDKALGLQ